VPRGRRVPGHAPGLVAIDHQGDALAVSLADGLHRAELFTPILAVEAQLHRLKSFLDPAADGLHRFRTAAPLAERGILPEARRRAAKKPPDRLACGLAHDVPQREIERPMLAVVEAQVVEDAVVAGGVAPGAGGGKILVAGEPRDRVTRAATRDTPPPPRPNQRGAPRGARAGAPRPGLR